MIGCYLDLENSEIAYTKNGVDLGLAFTIPEGIRRQNFFPAVVLKVCGSYAPSKLRPE